MFADFHKANRVYVKKYQELVKTCPQEPELTLTTRRYRFGFVYTEIDDRCWRVHVFIDKTNKAQNFVWAEYLTVNKLLALEEYLPQECRGQLSPEQLEELREWSK